MKHLHLSRRDLMFVARFRLTGDAINISFQGTTQRRSVEELRALSESANRCEQCNATIELLRDELDRQRKATVRDKVAGRVRVVNRPGELKLG